MTDKCGCGKPVRYKTSNGMACNKSMRCLTRDEALEALRGANKKAITLEYANKKLRDAVVHLGAIMDIDDPKGDLVMDVVNKVLTDIERGNDG